jgi:hypothetical protein
MKSQASNRTVGLTVIAVLALVQGLFGVLRTLHWFDLGSDLMGQGLLLLPVIWLLAIGRGMLVAVLAVLFAVVSYGLLSQRRWARWLAIVLSIVTLLLAVRVVIQGESPARALVWSLIPVVMLGYLISPSGRQALNADSNAE